MPLYDYHCNDCNEEFSIICKYNEHPDECQLCNSTDIKRQLSRPVLRTEGGLESMSVKHTTSEYFGPQGSIGKEEYFPEERKRKSQEKAKKEASKGSTVSLSK